LTFEQWFDQRRLVADYLELDLEAAFRSLAEDAWREAFEAGENVACEGAYDDGYNAGYREGIENTAERAAGAYKEGHADGYKEGLSFRMEDFV
jgi:flagellar biosynthesis/type III secretory pathway protein FliH